MKALVQDRYGATDVLRLEDIETPQAGDDEVVVKVHAAGVDAGVWHIMAGEPYLVRLFGFGLRKPKVRVRGLELAGTVAEVGKNVTKFRPGDEVFGTSSNGTFAEFTLVPETRLALKPASLTLEQSAAVPVSACTALQSLRDAGRLRAGQSVLIIGAGGGVGTFAVQLAKALGAEVTGVCSTSKMDLVRSLGADRIIDYTREDFAEADRRYDLILDIAGNSPLSRLRRALVPTGTAVLVGGEGGGRWVGAVSRNLRAGLISPFVRQKLRGLLASTRADDLRAITDFIDAGTVTPVIERTYRLEEAPEAIARQHAGKVLGKVVVAV